MQICLEAKYLSSEPSLFLDSSCARLRNAFGFGGLLLKPADEGTPETGSTLTWHGPCSLADCPIAAGAWAAACGACDEPHAGPANLLLNPTSGRPEA